MLRFQERLSLRRIELMEEGVAGSSGLERGGVDFVSALAMRGSAGFKGAAISSVPPNGRVKSPRVLERWAKEVSRVPDLGTEDDRKGDRPDRGFPVLPVTDSEELVVSAAKGLSCRRWCTELLLLSWMLIGSVLSSSLLREKKELFDAVIGVEGVFAICLDRGGLECRSAEPCSFNAAILAAVGVAKGPKFSGGSCSGCRFFLEDDPPPACLSDSSFETGFTDFRMLIFLGAFFGGSVA